MRTIVKLAYTAGAVIMAGCSGADAAMNDDLRKDLEMAWSSDEITLAGANRNAGRQVVSAIERDAPAPRKVAPSRRVAKHRPAPRTPAPVEVAEADIDEEVEVVEAEVTPSPREPAPEAVATLPSPRPQPVSHGDDAGIVMVVLRGGGVDGDDCDEHIRRGRNGRNGRDGRMGGGMIGAGRIGGGMIGTGRIGGGAIIAINSRLPIPTPFPGRTRF